MFRVWEVRVWEVRVWEVRVWEVRVWEVRVWEVRVFPGGGLANILNRSFVAGGLQGGRGARRPDPALLVLDASRQEAEVIMDGFSGDASKKTLPPTSLRSSAKLRTAVLAPRW